MNRKNNNTANIILDAVKNLNASAVDAIRSFAPLRMTKGGVGMTRAGTMMMVAFTFALSALTFSSCTQDDLVPPTNAEAGTLHIASVTIDGQQAARTRVAADGGEFTMSDLPYNQSFNAFTAGDRLMLMYDFGDGMTDPAYATYNGSAWTIISDEEGESPLIIQPSKGSLNTEKWADAYMTASFSATEASLSGGAALAKANELGAVQGTIPTEDIYLMADELVASSSDGQQQDFGYGPITIDTDVKSPTLGAVNIQLKHANRALLRLPLSDVNVEPGTYIVNGKAHTLDENNFGTLWAEVSYDYGTLYGYFPLTKVTIDGTDYLQAIVYAAPNGYCTLTGFKAVMNVSASSATLTLDLPFTVDSEQATGSVPLQPNTRYPLTLTIAPNRASVTLTTALGKPGWGTDEEELSNEMNELAAKALSEGQVSYDANTQTFSVSGPEGLMLVNKYLTGEIAAGAIDGWPDVDALMAQNIILTTDITLPTPAEGESNWSPIGDYSNPYTGIIDGSGHTLTGLTIHQPEAYHQGLVGYLKDGCMKNCHLVSGTVTGGGTVGGIVGYNAGIVMGCTNAATVNGLLIAGGIVGVNVSTVVACGNTGTVTGTNYVGGIVGYNDNGGNVIGSWTVDTNEHKFDSGVPTGKDGIGDNNNTITHCYSGDGSTINSKVSDMNTALATFYNNIGASLATKYYWAVGTDGYPTLTTTAPATDN